MKYDPNFAAILTKYLDNTYQVASPCSKLDRILERRYREQNPKLDFQNAYPFLEFSTKPEILPCSGNSLALLSKDVSSSVCWISSLFHASLSYLSFLSSLHRDQTYVPF